MMLYEESRTREVEAVKVNPWNDEKSIGTSKITELKCKKCGMWHDDGFQFCPNCGERSVLGTQNREWRDDRARENFETALAMKKVEMEMMGIEPKPCPYRADAEK